LEVADEMPADRGPDGVHFGKRLLDSIFADVVKSGIDRGLDRIRTVGLGYGHDGHRLPMPAPADGGIDSITDFPKALGKV
jgi:hypothetical protein